MAALHNVVYLTEAQYATLKTNGTITVDGVTYTFNENDLYLTPQGNVLSGDGSDVTVAFSAASTRANISTGEKLSVIFGKIAKWFADLKSAAFRDATSSISSGSTDLVESGAVHSGLAGKQPTITASGILKGDGNGGVSAAVAGTDYATPVEVITVSGSTPSITAVAGKRYVCGECSTLTIIVPASGIIDVIFESGTTATVLTITPATGHTVVWANGFDPTSLDASTTYELNIMDGLGVAASWT